MPELHDYTTNSDTNNDLTQGGLPEGVAPRFVNDWARDLMAAIRRYIELDWAELLTTGTATAYVLTTTQSLQSLPSAGRRIAFRAHVSCGANPTLNIDSTGARPLINLAGNRLNADDIHRDSAYTVFMNGARTDYIVAGGTPTGDLADRLAQAEIDIDAAEVVTARVNPVIPASSAGVRVVNNTSNTSILLYNSGGFGFFSGTEEVFRVNNDGSVLAKGDITAHATSIGS